MGDNVESITAEIPSLTGALHCKKENMNEDVQLQNIVKWFEEFGEIEKEDFLVELLNQVAPGQIPVGLTLAKLNIKDKPPTLFDCRMLLFNNWFEGWSEEIRDEFIERIKESDSKFFERFQLSKDLPNDQKSLDEFFLCSPDSPSFKNLSITENTQNGINGELNGCKDDSNQNKVSLETVCSTNQVTSEVVEPESERCRPVSASPQPALITEDTVTNRTQSPQPALRSETPSSHPALSSKPEIAPKPTALLNGSPRVSKADKMVH